MTPTEADAAQEWGGMDGCTAFMLISRHSDSLDEAGEMMQAWLRANASRASAQEPVARLLHWKGPAHMPVPHGGISARTYAEFSKDTADKDRYWVEGAPLYTSGPSTPKGWQLVPVEPTREMAKASFDLAGVTSPDQYGQRRMIAIAWHSMLAAAPKPGEPK